MNAQEAIATPWRRASLAAALFAIDPVGTGILVRCGPGPVRDAWLALLTRSLGVRRLLRMPAQIADDRLIGGLDVAATLRAGRLVADSGLIAAANGGVLALAMAERVSPSVAARLCGALDSGEIGLQRDGLSLNFPARFGVVALDEGQGEDEHTPPALVERLAYWIDLDSVGRREIEEPAFDAAEIADAAGRLPAVAADERAVEALVAVGVRLGVASLRAPLFALKAARALAALRGADTVDDDDLALAASLAIAPRATRLPVQEEAAEPPPPEPDADEAPPEAPDDDRAPSELEEQVLAAAAAAIPAGLLASLQAGLRARRRASSDGKSGADSLSSQRGRPLDARPGSLSKGRLSLVATLRAAAPWRRLRERDAPAGEPRRLIVKPEDFRITRYRQRRGATTVFVVDASGSAAMQRLAEVKGAIELLLADCYVRRDNVALVAFRGRGAEVALPPTRSTARARRALAGLPGGGGTPVACGLDAALGLADQAQRKGQTPLIVLMTDGRANIGRDGAPGREKAMQDAIDAGRRIRAAGVAALAIDTSGPSARADSPTRTLAEAMQARYIKLPFADAASVNAAVRDALPT